MAIKVNSNNLNTNTPSFKGWDGHTIKSEMVQEWIKKAGNANPAYNRLFLGATALMTQPFIDLYNKRVDEETRRVSFARTIAKAIVGTITGVAVRGGCIKAIKSFTDITCKEGTKNWRTSLIPEGVTIKEFELAARLMKKHREAIGMFLALAVMLVTNFAIDVPLTKALTNILNKKVQKTDEKKSIEKGGK